MLAPMKKMYDTSGPNVVKALNKRQFEAYYCSTAAEAVEKVLELIPAGDVVSWGGVATVDQLGSRSSCASGVRQSLTATLPKRPTSARPCCIRRWAAIPS